MRKKIYVSMGILLIIVAMVFWWVMPEKQQVSIRMPIILVDAESGETITSKLYVQGTWMLTRCFQDKLQFVGNFMVEDIFQTHIGGGNQYKLSFARTGEMYMTNYTEIDIASAAPIIKDFQLYTDENKSIFIGIWDIYLDGFRHEVSHFYFIAPAQNIDEARSVISQVACPTVIAEIDRVLPTN